MLKRYLSGLALVAMAAGAISTGNGAETGLALQTSNERGVKVTVTLQELSLEAKTWDFEVTLETHTQNLSDDLTRSASLVAEGKQYSPLGWEGAAPGGHHRKGLLRFQAIVPQPGSIELRIRLAGDAAPRSFKWILK